MIMACELKFNPGMTNKELEKYLAEKEVMKPYLNQYYQLKICDQPFFQWYKQELRNEKLIALGI